MVPVEWRCECGRVVLPYDVVSPDSGDEGGERVTRLVRTLVRDGRDEQPRSIRVGDEVTVSVRQEPGGVRSFVGPVVSIIHTAMHVEAVVDTGASYPWPPRVTRRVSTLTLAPKRGGKKKGA